MNVRLRVALLGIAGLAAAAALGVTGYLVTRETIALPATSISGGERLVPPRRAAARPAVQPPVTTRATPTTAAGTGTDADDGERRRGRGRGDDDPSEPEGDDSGSDSGSSGTQATTTSADSGGGSGQGRGRGRGGDDD